MYHVWFYCPYEDSGEVNHVVVADSAQDAIDRVKKYLESTGYFKMLHDEHEFSPQMKAWAVAPNEFGVIQ